MALSLLASSSAFLTMVEALSLASARMASFIFLILSSILPATIWIQLQYCFGQLILFSSQNQICRSSQILIRSTISMKIGLSIVVVFAIFCLANATGNPGILISVPFPINVPSITLPLPLPIEDIVISNLELTNTYLKQLDYAWRFDIKNAEIEISFAHISFDWFYKKDKGVGFFTEQNLVMTFFYSFIASGSNHFQINITSTKIKPGHSKVTLGGQVPQIVIVEVTNLILNHASILFRGFISKSVFMKGKQLSKTITDLGSTIGEDKKIFTDKATGKEFYVNMSLVAMPLASGQNLIVQMNGAPYVKGEKSGELNPDQILIRTNSTKIQVQLHKKIITQFIAQLLKAKGGQLSITLHSLQITSTLDINSLLLSPVFPEMVKFADERDVIFNLKVPSINFSFNGNRLRFQMPLFTNVVTYNTIEKRQELYIAQVNGKVAAEIIPIFGEIRNSIRIASVELISFQPDQKDIDQGRFDPVQIVPNFGALMEWIKDGINLDLNRKVVSLAYKEILAVLGGSVLKNTAYYLEVDLTENKK